MVHMGPTWLLAMPHGLPIWQAIAWPGLALCVGAAGGCCCGCAASPRGRAQRAAAMVGLAKPAASLQLPRWRVYLVEAARVQAGCATIASCAGGGWFIVPWALFCSCVQSGMLGRTHLHCMQATAWQAGMAGVWVWHTYQHSCLCCFTSACRLYCHMYK